MADVTLAAPEPLTALWLELTGRCQLECVMCYADSGPHGAHGDLDTAAWTTVLDQAVERGARMVCLIGGEPTTRPDLPALIDHALSVGLAVEVYTNLYRVPDSLWPHLAKPGVQLATTYLSDQAEEYDRITGRPGSHTRTRANIAKALRLGIPLRVSVIDTVPGQRVEQARADLIALGVPEDQVTGDHARGFGRGASAGIDESDTCGRCGHGVAVVLPDGSIAPCVMTRHEALGDVRRDGLDAVLGSPAFAGRVTHLDAVRRPATVGECLTCGPNSACRPSCSPSCSPLRAN